MPWPAQCSHRALPGPPTESGRGHRKRETIRGTALVVPRGVLLGEEAGALRRHLVAWGVRNATGGVTGPLSVACAAHRHAGAQTPRDSARSLDPFAARGRRPRVRGGWRPEAAIGGVGSAERYWRRERASLGCVCRPSARGCADIARLPARSTLLPREGAGRVCKRWLAAWRPEAAFG